MKFKKGFTIALTAVMASAGLAACGGSSGGGDSTTAADSSATTTASAASATTTAASSSSSGSDKVIRWGYTWGYGSLDAHVDYNGWNTAAMGVTESLFTIGEDLSIQPCLAKEAKSDDGITWTITLDEKAAFSNGDQVTADDAIANLKRLGEKNERFDRFAKCTYTKVNDTEFTVVSPDAYVTMKNDMASPEAAIMDLDNSKDLDNAPICTGPFVVDKFTPNGDESVKKNEKYWRGDVTLDGAELLIMADSDSKLMALQNGEIDYFDDVSASSKAVIESDPTFTLYNTPSTRLQFYLLNCNRLSEKVREAINMTIDKQSISDFLEGVTSVAETPYLPSTTYSKAKGVSLDTAKAQSLLEEDGYTKNSSGMYEKDGKPLTLTIKYYAAREFDKIAPLMQEQLKAIGVNAELSVEEDADAGYMANGDYDIALYCLIADKTGDPAYFINSVFADGSNYNNGGFKSEECQKLIDELNVEVDAAKRSDLANKIIQITLDENAVGYLGFMNRIIAAKQGVKNVSEKYPFDLYGLFADSTK